MEEDKDTDHLLTTKDTSVTQSDTNGGVAVYTQRWWVTFVFTLVSLAQALIWDTWGPIAESSELVFGWTDATIAQITNMSSIIYLFFAVPISNLMDAKGLRVSLLLCTALLFVCSVIRCFTTDPVIFTAMAYLSSSLHGIACIIPFSGPAMFASVWFPVRQRTMATAIVSFGSMFGLSIGFLIGPQLVPGPKCLFNSTLSASMKGEGMLCENAYYDLNSTYQHGTEIQTITNFESMRSGVKTLLYTHAIVAAICFVLVLVYFPAKPRKPPSITASLPRTNYRQAFGAIGRNMQLWLLVIVGAVPRGLVGAWIGMFDVVVKQRDVSQVDAGWVGFCYIIFGSFARILFAKIFDRIIHRKKTLMVILHTAALVDSIWVALLCDGTLSMDLSSLYVSCILFGVFVNGPVPLIYEMAAEAAYPVSEALSSAMYTLVVVVFEIMFYGVLSVQDVGVIWMTWACVGALGLTLPLLLVFKDRNTRYDIDITID